VLLLVVGPCYSACKLLICPSKLMRSNLSWSSPLRHLFSISAVLVQSHRACLFCWTILFRMMNLFDVCPSHHLWQSALSTLLSMNGHILINWMPLLLRWQQNRSKATMYLLYKIPAIRGCPRYCVACYCPTTTIEYTSTSRGTSVSSLVAVNIDFWRYFLFLSISLFETNGYSMPLKTYQAKLVFSFISQCCYFNSQCTPLPANKTPYVWKEICQLGQLHSCSLLTCINQGCGGV